MKKKLLILFLILACSTNAYSNEIIYQNCVHGKDGIQMENKKNKEGVKMYDKFLMKINIAKAEVVQEIYVTKEHLDSVKKQNPDFVIPKIPMIRTSKIIFVDEDKIHRIMQENKKKNANKKKSKFQARLEDAMKASQEAQKKNKKK